MVTGGNSGLGQAFSVALAKAGANVLIPTLADDGGETTRMIEAAGVRADMMLADITEPDVPQQIVETCAETFGSLDILVNCAGVCLIEPDVTKFGRAQWDTMIRVNLTAAFEMSHEAAKLMIPRRRGKIINICSLFSYLGGQWSPAYAASKHGLAGLTKSYCDELAQFNIQVNAIAPGYFATKMTAKTRNDPGVNKKIVDHIPANRWGDLKDLMGATVFLASPASDYVNGQTLVVDGGYLVR